MNAPHKVAVGLQAFETHLVRVETPFGRYQGLLANFDGRLCWLADPEDQVERPPIACVSLREDWAVRHVHEGCPACEEEEEESAGPVEPPVCECPGCPAAHHHPERHLRALWWLTNPDGHEEQVCDACANKRVPTEERRARLRPIERDDGHGVQGGEIEDPVRGEEGRET